MKSIAEITAAKNYFSRDNSTIPIISDTYHSIADVVADAKNFFYMCCQKSHSGINADMDYAYTCIACKEDTLAKSR
ncbi:hypothetical protein ACJIZ3_008796 [Penstemon smallii]|uniref:Uncharacterized protein n=1 Tax=Penstemon smallii TaxID=265156 RepID=A0ABD3TBK4_9LAMI